MKSINPPPPPAVPRWGVRLAGLVLLGIVLLLVIAFFRPSPPPPPPTNPRPAGPAMTVTHSGRGLGTAVRPADFTPPPARPAEEIVAEKVSQFAHSREALVTAMAKHFNVAVPPDVSRFFATAQAGNWPETTNLFAALQKLRNSENWPPGLERLMPAIVETYGAAEQAHAWPAQKLLDYGNAILDSLRPGMVYVGGTDAGRFIPTLLGETSEGEHHIVLTQNALADGSYLDYLQFQYGDRLNTLTTEDSQTSFANYLADAQKRLQHDRDFPDAPKQLQSGEEVKETEGRLQVSGQVAVMAINERLLQTLLTKNPDLSFALTESFPLKSFYGAATTLGPVTELRATDTANALTPEHATQSLDYWRSTTQALLADPEAAASSTARDDYAKLILGQAGLLLDRKLPAAAEQAYQLASSLSPGNPEVVFGYVALLADQKRYADARQVVQTALNTAPDNDQFRALRDQLGRMK